jgi:hypothetical protein
MILFHHESLPSTKHTSQRVIWCNTTRRLIKELLETLLSYSVTLLYLIVQCPFMVKYLVTCYYLYKGFLLLGWTESFCIFQMKSQSFFFNIFIILNQLYNFHCLLLPSPNMSQAFQFRPCKNFLVCLRHLFENAKTFRSTQYLSREFNLIK